jgi:hypothetical protein
MTSAQELLDAIEQTEMCSLAWGYVDGSLSRDEAIALARQLPRARGASDEEYEDLLEDLLDAQLVFELTGGRLRSRFAETLRLMVRSRQMFRSGQWQGAPRLVADFRVDRRPRLFPRRDVLPLDAWAQMPPTVQQDSLRRTIWERLTHDERREPLALAQFQVSAAARLLAAPPNDSATIVTAGTGSGKTFCFYLPALAEMAARVAAGSSHTLALAMYPRVELLKDQLREAVRLSDRLAPLLLERGSRPLRIGVYYGDTPNNRAQFETDWRPKNWKRNGRGNVCPFLRCLRCNAELVWQDDDAQRSVERLRCTAGRCDGEVRNVVLTRDALKAGGCDLLFITTESLNARMTERALRPVLGLDRSPEQRPAFVLLDEVHTYAGGPGAQVALTLARWRAALGAGSAVRWIGLSATLRDADEFFATMTGVGASNVVTISPALDECFEQACEYQVVLRGDPSGQTSLLSTTIQTAMLVGRMADGRRNRTDGVVGTKTFVFTDDLDVNNRLYHNLADAEAYRVRNNRLLPDGARQPLAVLRGNGSDAVERDADGQRWWAAEKIASYGLDERLPLGRTTSQDSGVDADATMVVATASLEVGFNDPSVGFVIQHKAPRGAAGFLQRKGRAGRSQVMRPWMITVLSDYGRDRAAFSAYEQLFDPALPATNLPVDNLYVLRIQATFSLLEWLYGQWKNKPSYAYLWSVAAGPRSPASQRQAIAAVLKALMNDEASPLRQSLATHLQRALRVSHERIDLILWQPPRGLMLEVIPTLWRRLVTNWQLAFPDKDGQTEPYERTPLPEFLPSRLFSELQLPEVQVTPYDGVDEAMAVGSALNLLVPGRVSRRFAPFDSSVSHWLPIDVNCEDEVDVVELAPYVPRYDRVELAGSELVVVRPREVCLEKAPKQVLPTSNARWRWQSIIQEGEAPVALITPRRGAWSAFAAQMDAHLYSRRSPVRVQRYAEEGEAKLSLKSGNVACEKAQRFTLSFDGKAAAVGLEQEVDGLRISLRLPPDAVLAARGDWPTDAMAACRTMRLRHNVSQNAQLAGLANVFQLDWLAQVFLAAAVAAADANRWDFATSCDRVTVGELEDAVGVLFPMLESVASGPVDEESEDEADDLSDSPRGEQKLVQKLRQMLQLPAVVEALRATARAAMQPDPASWGQWLRELMCESAAVAVSEAAALVVPRNNATDTLLSDWTWDDTSNTLTLWLTEQALGGAGMVEELAHLCASEPRKLWRAVEAALAASDVERASDALQAMCRRIRDDAGVASLAQQCADSVGHVQRAAALEQLAATLRHGGHAVGRTFGVNANARLLRPGMRRSTWELLAELDEHRVGLQARLGVIVDLRVFCRIAAVHPRHGPAVRAELSRLRGGVPASEGASAQILSGILWPQPVELRAARRPSWHPYRTIGAIEAGLLRSLLVEKGAAPIDVRDTDWRERLAELLRQQGSARLSASDADRALLSDAIAWLSTTPVDVGWLHLHAAVERIEASEGRVTVALELREIG